MRWSAHMAPGQLTPVQRTVADTHDHDRWDWNDAYTEDSSHWLCQLRPDLRYLRQYRLGVP